MVMVALRPIPLSGLCSGIGMKVSNNLKCLFLLFVFLTTVLDAGACRKKVVVTNSKNLIELFKTEKATYVIIDDCDLKGKTLKISRDCYLQFDGGKIKNGIIEGNNTSIEAEKLRLFENVTIYGVWSNKMVYSEWLDFKEGEKIDNARNFQNLMTLCNGDALTHLYTQHGIFYCSVKDGSSDIQVPSNVYWHNSSIICQLPTESAKFSFVELYKSKYVTVDGRGDLWAM